MKNAQEAHEAIRPAGHPFDLPETLRGDAQPGRVQALRPDLEADGGQPDGRRPRPPHHDQRRGGRRAFEASGKIIDFPGYLRAYVEGSDDPESQLADRDVVLPAVAVGEALACRGLEPKSHTTQPPNRYSEASLTRALEEMGIGRPSTYASIIDTILARDYVFKSSAATCWCPRGRRLPFRSCSSGICRIWSITSSPPRWKTSWTPSAAANWSTWSTCSISTSATITRA